MQIYANDSVSRNSTHGKPIGRPVVAERFRQYFLDNPKSVCYPTCIFWATSCRDEFFDKNKQLGRRVITRGWGI
ncbi:MAG: hypothetical protein ACE5I1_32695 [bacterium]